MSVSLTVLLFESFVLRRIGTADVFPVIVVVLLSAAVVVLMSVEAPSVAVSLTVLLFESVV